ncbi:hypothetical protein DL766_009336 [Monosporascus sp. MC13-8B]|uniref:Cytochrome P450 n=1 Tax=Monosporascus cannonballus TaxID=155416 RepID=A0ABY0GYB2_9PEZI|nr:hypothetical protein DL763_009038 [Monosporascus cannonballus]RYO80282.1 hypothetical protein DL762_007729 [Monosporascus cannonballus]RYP15693.1 hypothetical protein DL766_009336 [Monosporascus sp. MC13-8B]
MGSSCFESSPEYSVSIYPTYFSNPFIYHPERWIPGEGDAAHESVEREHSVLNPFSVGVRSCLGKAMAVTELQLAVAALLASYDFELAQGKLGLVGDGQPGPGNTAPWLVFKARKH